MKNMKSRSLRGVKAASALIRIHFRNTCSAASTLLSSYQVLTEVAVRFSGHGTGRQQERVASANLALQEIISLHHRPNEGMSTLYISVPVIGLMF